MELKNIILVIIAILIIALVGVGLYVLDNPTGNLNIPTDLNLSLDEANKTVNITAVTNDTNATVPDNTTNSTNATVVGDNTPRSNDTAANNTTYKVYNPQTDSYVPVIGEKFDDEVNRWYTYDSDGVRYYNTRINTP